MASFLQRALGEQASFCAVELQSDAVEMKAEVKEEVLWNSNDEGRCVEPTSATAEVCAADVASLGLPPPPPPVPPTRMAGESLPTPPPPPVLWDCEYWEGRLSERGGKGHGNWKWCGYKGRKGQDGGHYVPGGYVDASGCFHRLPAFNVGE